MRQWLMDRELSSPPSLPHRRAPLGTLSSLYRRVEERWWDYRLGIDTRSGRKWTGSVPPHCVPYEPLPYRVLERALRTLTVTERDVLLDYGCGKGRALVAAAQRPFARVLGVELVPELTRAARANVARAHRRLACQVVQVYESDARTFDVPDDVTVIFMFNPFDGALRGEVADRVEESLLRRPRRLTVLAIDHLRNGDIFPRPWLVRKRELAASPLDWMCIRVYGTRMAALRDLQRQSQLSERSDAVV